MSKVTYITSDEYQGYKLVNGNTGNAYRWHVYKGDKRLTTLGFKAKERAYLFIEGLNSK